MSDLSVHDMTTARSSALPWVAPFAAFMLWMVIWPFVKLGQPWEEALRFGLLAVVLLTVSRPVIRTLRVTHWLPSIGVGLAVFVLWVLPEQLWPGYRSHWLFQNAVTGETVRSIPDEWLTSPLLLTLRIARAAILVPVLEEIFWRGFLPRWVVDNDWDRVPMGTYNTLAFVGTALLFASEHGPYWDVGLMCGLIYNWYMWKRRSLGDLVLVHAVTNGALSVFVLMTRQYAFWM
jgi:CAAX prenyl protease-like protein